jgi:hypothetical protein
VGLQQVLYVVGGTIPRNWEVGATTTIMGQKGYPYRVLVKSVHEETNYIAG